MRRLSAQYGVSQRTVSGILRMKNLLPYHVYVYFYYYIFNCFFILFIIISSISGYLLFMNPQNYQKQTQFLFSLFQNTLDILHTSQPKVIIIDPKHWQSNLKFLMNRNKKGNGIVVQIMRMVKKLILKPKQENNC